MNDVMSLKDRTLKRAVVKLAIERSRQENRLVRESDILREALLCFGPLEPYRTQEAQDKEEEG